MLKHNWINKNKKYAFSGISKIYEHYKGAVFGWEDWERFFKPFPPFKS